MKTSEFIEKVKALEFVGGIEKKRYERFREYKNCLTVVSENNTVIAAVSTDVEFLVGTRFYTFYSLNVEQRKQLFDLLTEYAATPISERRDKTIEEKAREYMKECMNDNLNFYSCVDNLEYNRNEKRESEIYQWYRDNSNEFVKMWCEVAADES
ncbi:hypothetical protein [Enterococcus sp. AZ102]|uniref:hypothetical protein n=1 Tax=Enterococcus sp. AZ102 TaxID=2774865 RepID=UPI003F299573